MKIKFRPTSILMVFLLICGLFPCIVSTAYADTDLKAGSYEYCTSQGFTSHGYNEIVNQTQFWGMLPGPNCTDYAAYMMVQAGAATPVNNLGNAKDWDNNAPSYATVNQIPTVGSIAQWEAYTPGNSEYGHVAYVESVSADGSITVSEDNYLYGPFRWRVINVGSGNWPSHFIHFKDAVVLGNDSTVTSFVTSDGICHAISGTATGSVYETWFGTGTINTSQLWAGNGSAVNSVSSFITGNIQHVISGTATGSVYETWFGTGTITTNQLK